ncbi:uncharacterized protein [Dermacentor albipictus]|uniref:uncharacterized protein n=1 Tax=Dermacentor albipictus TaxID=60249 RepID=UPI0031FE09E3
MAATGCVLPLFYLIGVVMPEVHHFSTSPWLCHRFISAIPTFYARQCTFPCRLISEDADFRSTPPIIFQMEQDGTPCTAFSEFTGEHQAGHCIRGTCVPLQAHHALKRQKRSLLLTLTAVHAVKKLKEAIASRREG